MFDWLKQKLIKKFLVGFVLKKIDEALAQLPANDAKTITGFIVALLGLIVYDLPSMAAYIQPILDYLHTLPATEITGGGLLYMALGLVHKGIKKILKSAGQEPAPAPIEKKIEKAVAKIVESSSS